MSHNLRVALSLAAQGLFVFPVQNAPGEDRHKKPYPHFWWRSKSTTAAAEIEAWWRLWPDALPAIDCGKSGLVVVDLDKPGRKKKADGLAAWGELAAGREPSCPISETPSGGRHLIFRQPSPALTNRKGGLPKGIDVRGAGGYIVAPGARCLDGAEYRLAGQLAEAPLPPDWLVGIIKGEAPKEAPAAPSAPRPAAAPIQAAGGNPAYVETAIAAELDKVRSAAEGGRNNQLNISACALGNFVAAGEIGESEARARLLEAALACGLKDPEALRTISSGLTRGMQEPRAIPVSLRAAQEAKGAELARSLMRTSDGDLIDAQTGEVVAEPAQPQPAGALPDHLMSAPGLVGDIQDWILMTARYPSPAMALLAALLVVGTAIGRDRAGPTHSATHLYGLALAPTGTGKAHPMEQAARLMQASGMSGQIGPSKFKSGVGVISLLSRMPVSLCFFDEFGGYMAKLTDRYSGAHVREIMDIWRELWGKSFALYRTDEGGSKQAESISAPALSILGTSTEEEFYASLKGREVLNGFLNRFLLTVEITKRPEQEPVLDPFQVPSELASRLAYLNNAGGNLKGLTQTMIMPRMVPWADAEAKGVYDGIVSPDGEQKPYYTRTREMAVRVATIIACGIDSDAPTITAEVMAWSRDLALHSAATMVRGVGAYVAETEDQARAKEIERLVREAGGPITHKDLCRRLKHKYRSDIAKKLIETLLESGAIVADRLIHAGGGRPTTVYSCG